MSNRSLALVILTGAGLLALVSTLPFVLRSVSPDLFGTDCYGHDVLDPTCYVITCLYSVAAFLAVILVPLTGLFWWVVPKSVPAGNRSRRILNCASVVALGLWVGSFFFAMDYNNGSSYSVEFHSGIASIQWGPIPQPNPYYCLLWYDTYTRSPNEIRCRYKGYGSHNYLWRFPGELKSRLLPSFHSDQTLRFLRLPFWPVAAPLAAWSIVAWWRKRQPRSIGYCRVCQYNLRGNTSGICSECGAMHSKSRDA